MAFNAMAVVKVEFKPPFDKCMCCLKNGLLEDLWSEHLRSDGEIEVYGKMLQECFQFSWPAADKYMEQICDKCIQLLKVSLEFRRSILAAREKLEHLTQENNELTTRCTKSDHDEVDCVAIKQEIDESECSDQEILKRSPESQKQHSPGVADNQASEFVSCDIHEKYENDDNLMEMDNLENSYNVSEQAREQMNSSSDEELDFEHENDEEATILSQKRLPSRSREKYAKAYEDFIKWRTEKKANSVSENVLLAYFHELSKIKRPSTLWCEHSKLKTTIRLKHNINIGDYANLIMFLKQKSDGFIPKKSKVLSGHDIETFIQEAPDEIYLLEKVVLIFGLTGACRSNEMTSLKVNDVETVNNKMIVTLRCAQTKNHRMFVVQDELLKVVQKYQNLRPVYLNSDRFFMNFKNGRYTKQVVGRHKIAAVPKKIAAYLNLPDSESYTGHCFRRSSACLLAGSGVNLATLKKHGGWLSDKIPESYIKESIENHSKTTNEAIDPRPSTSSDVTSGPTLKVSPSGPTLNMNRSGPTLNAGPSGPTLNASQSIQQINLPGKSVQLSLSNCSNFNVTFNVD